MKQNDDRTVRGARELILDLLEECFKDGSDGRGIAMGAVMAIRTFVIDNVGNADLYADELRDLAKYLVEDAPECIVVLERAHEGTWKHLVTFSTWAEELKGIYRYVGKRTSPINGGDFETRLSVYRFGDTWMEGMPIEPCPRGRAVSFVEDHWA